MFYGLIGITATNVHTDYDRKENESIDMLCTMYHNKHSLHNECVFFFSLYMRVVFFIETFDKTIA